MNRAEFAVRILRRLGGVPYIIEPDNITPPACLILSLKSKPVILTALECCDLTTVILQLVFVAVITRMVISNNCRIRRVNIIKDNIFRTNRAWSYAKV
jgi:hypothetical protein